MPTIPGTPGLGFSSTTPVPSIWFNHVSTNWYDLFNGITGGTFQNVGDIVFKSTAARFKLNYPDITHQIELRGFVTMDLSDIGGMPVGVGAFTCNLAATFNDDVTIDALSTFTVEPVILAQGGINATNSNLNADAIGATGNGTGRGITATGGATAGTGVYATGGGGSGGPGIEAYGQGSAAGGMFSGGATGAGLVAQGGGGNAPGIRSYGDGTGPALQCEAGGIYFVGTQPAANASPGSNMAHATNQAKAWGYITTDGLGGYTVQDGYNISSVTLAATRIDVNFALAMGSTLYATIPAIEDGSSFVASCDKPNSTASMTRIIVRDGGVVQNPTAVVMRISFVVFARQ